MFDNEDKEYLNNSDYSLALEKYFNLEYYRHYDRLTRNENNRSNGTIYHAYPFSNELLAHMFSQLSIQDTKVLTVGSSGDQLLNALFYGAKDVTLIDANLYTKYWTQYKIAAIKNLDYKTFYQFFIMLDNPFNKIVYSRIFQDLDEDSQIFWGTILIEDPSRDLYSKILSRNDFSHGDIDSIFFDNKKAYERMQDILNKDDFNINFLNGEFNEFDSLIDGKFDFIFLSNIFDYVKNSDFLRVVNNLYDNNLNDGGKIQLQYDFTEDSQILYALFHDKTVKSHLLQRYVHTYFLEKPPTSIHNLDEDEMQA